MPLATNVAFRRQTGWQGARHSARWQRNPSVPERRRRNTVLDTLEGITDLHEMIAAVIRSALVDEALHVGLRSRLDDMKERLSRLESELSKKRQLSLEAMTEAGLSKLEQPDFTASARAGSPALVVIAEETIPAAYWLPHVLGLTHRCFPAMICEMRFAGTSSVRASPAEERARRQEFRRDEPVDHF